MKKTSLSIILSILLTLSFVGSAFAENQNPGVIPNEGPAYGDLSAQWWQWAFSFPLAEVPFLNEGGPVDISAGQSGNVWFLAGVGGGMGPVTRSGEVPAGTSLFFPMRNIINDYPCPPEYGFEPPAGESIADFLLRTGNEYLDLWFVPDPSLLFAEIDGVSLMGLDDYRSASPMFTFTASTDLLPLDPCITGTPQQGVALGYSLLLPPLPPGTHTLHFGYSTDQDITYELTVVPGR